MLDIWNGGFRMVLAVIIFFAAVHFLVEGKAPRGPVPPVTQAQPAPGPEAVTPWR